MSNILIIEYISYIYIYIIYQKFTIYKERERKRDRGRIYNILEFILT